MQIYSYQINPFVRFAGYRTSLISMNKNLFARDARMFYFVKGEAKIKINGITHSAKTGDLFIVPPMISYCIPDNHTAEYYLVNFDFTMDNKNIECAIPVLTHKEEPLYEVNIIDFPQFKNEVCVNIKAIEQYFSAMTDLYKNKPIYFRCEMNAYFTLILSCVFKKIINKKSDKNISVIIDYINSHYSEDLTNEEIGSFFNYHPNYINRLFVRHTGMTLHKYLINYRIEKAVNLLGETKLSISEIACKTGWPSVSAFSNYFKKTTGYSPSRFRIK